MHLSGPFLAALLAVPTQGRYIVPGGRWHDTNGSVINAHGAGITFDHQSGRFWWFGEYKTEKQPEGGGVAVYSSEDLSTWTFGGLALGIFPFVFSLFFLDMSRCSDTLRSNRGTSLYLTRKHHPTAESCVQL